MKIIKIILIVLIYAAAMASSMAQSGLSIRDVHGELSTRSTYQPTNISVEDVRYSGIDFITYSDTVIMRNCATILRNDLDFSPYFAIVLLDSFFLRHMELIEMSMLGWQRLGSEYLVKLDAEFPRNRLRLSYRLFSVAQGREIRRKSFEDYKEAHRYIVHDIANDIVKTLTGDEGIYRTKIAYVREIDKAKEIFMADFDGYGEVQLTNNGSINISPAVSPDGKYIYFTSYMDGEPRLYRLNLKNNDVKQIAGYAGLNAAPAVSPDGEYIACVLSRDGNSEIYLLDKDGKIKRRLTKHPAIDTSPTWSPDGREIAFISDRTGLPQIYAMDNEGLNVRRLTFQGSYNDSPRWSPRGDRIVFVSRQPNFKVCSVDITGKNFQVLTDLGNNENPHYSPDGNHIIFSSNRLGPTELYVMDFLGNNQKRLTMKGGFSNPIWLPLEK